MRAAGQALVAGMVRQLGECRCGGRVARVACEKYMLIKDIMRPKPSPPSFENRSFSAEKPEISCIQTDPYAAGVLGCAPGGMQAFLSGKELVCDREHTGAERMQHTAKSATALYSCEYGGWVGIPLSSAASIKAGAKLHSSFDS